MANVSAMIMKPAMPVPLSPALSRKRARGMRSDEATSHSTKPNKSTGQVAGYRNASFTLKLWLTGDCRGGAGLSVMRMQTQHGEELFNE